MLNNKLFTDLSPDNNCPKCNEYLWGILPDGSNYYCTKCIPDKEIFQKYEPGSGKRI